MFAIVRLNSFDPIKLATSPALEQFDQIHRTQPGYVGTIVVDLQAGRRLVLNLWESGEHGVAALSMTSPAGSWGRLRPNRAAPAELYPTIRSNDNGPCWCD